MDLNIRHFESLLGKAGLVNTGENRRLLEKCIREAIEMERLPLEDVLNKAYDLFQNPETRNEFEEKVISEKKDGRRDGLAG